jgi:rRNA maturation endonuclease Nob1
MRGFSFLKQTIMCKVVSIIPFYYCDDCGHAFNTPDNKAYGWQRVSCRDEFDTDERCPKCGNPDFETLRNEYEQIKEEPSSVTTRRYAKASEAYEVV